MEATFAAIRAITATKAISIPTSVFGDHRAININTKDTQEKTNKKACIFKVFEKIDSSISGIDFINQVESDINTKNNIKLIL